MIKHLGRLARRIVVVMTITTALAVVAVVTSSVCQAEYYSAGELHQYCESDSTADYQGGVCDGYITAIADTMSDAKCRFHSGIRIGHVVDVVVKYLREHPETWRDSAASAVEAALRKAFPCNKGGAK